MHIPLTIFPGDEEMAHELLCNEIAKTKEELDVVIAESEEFLQKIARKNLGL